MENNTITIIPGQDTAIAPAEPGGRRSIFSPFDSKGRERRHIFVRRMNSAALALFADTLISTIVMLLLIVVILFCLGIFALSNFTNLAESLMSGDNDMDGFAGIVSVLANIAMAVALVTGHIIPAYMHSSRNNFSLSSTMKRGSRLGLTLPAAIVVALGITYAWVFIYAICGKLMPESFFADRDVFADSFRGMDTATMIVSGVTTGILVPIAEEILFRGALLKSFSKYGTGFAVIASSVLFGIMHGNMLQTPFATLGGMVMAYVAIRSGSIWPSIIIHMCINSYSVICESIKAVLPSEHTEMLQYIINGLSGLFILGAVIILCTCARRIHWTAIDPDSNNILLPQVQTKVRCKGLRFVLSFGILIFLVVFLVALAMDAGLFSVPAESLANFD